MYRRLLRKFIVRDSVAIVNVGYRGDNSLSSEETGRGDEARTGPQTHGKPELISHDIGAPLRLLASYLQLLDIGLTDKLDAAMREYLSSDLSFGLINLGLQEIEWVILGHFRALGACK